MKFYNKCSENPRSQIVFRTDIFRKLMLGAPEFKTEILQNSELSAGRVIHYVRVYYKPGKRRSGEPNKNYQELRKIQMLIDSRIKG